MLEGTGFDWHCPIWANRQIPTIFFECTSGLENDWFSCSGHQITFSLSPDFCKNKIKYNCEKGFPLTRFWQFLLPESHSWLSEIRDKSPNCIRAASWNFQNGANAHLVSLKMCQHISYVQIFLPSENRQTCKLMGRCKNRLHQRLHFLLYTH